MNVLVTGCSGYVGSLLIQKIKSNNPNIHLVGLDSLLFGNLSHYSSVIPEFYLDKLLVSDLRDIESIFSKYDLAIDVAVHLGAISNDPISDKFNTVTNDVNFDSTIRLAKALKLQGCKKFIFASSASVYGFNDSICNEDSEINPLTQYAKSKAQSEIGLKELASSDFHVIIYRFATACGWSPRFRTDVVLNNFITTAVLNGNIVLNSTGQSIRPLITVNDMCKSIIFAIENNFFDYNIYNVANINWNFKISNLASTVATLLGVELITKNQDLKDGRSYAIDSTKFLSKIEDNFFEKSIEDVILSVSSNMRNVLDGQGKYFNSLVRLEGIESFQKKGIIDSEIRRIT